MVTLRLGWGRFERYSVAHERKFLLCLAVCVVSLPGAVGRTGARIQSFTE